MFVVFLLHCDGTQLFTRNLIRYDDHIFVAGFRTLGITGYFGDWLWRKDVYAFPFRDLLHFIDFWVEDTTGLRTFLLQNILIFVACGFLFFRVARRLLPWSWALCCTSIAFLHPLNVQVVQWTSARKHLVTALFAMAMVDVATRLAPSQRSNTGAPNLRWPHFVLLFLFQIAISLSYMSGHLAFLVPTALIVAFSLETKSEERNALIMKSGFFVAISGVVVLVLARFFIAQNSDFSKTTSSGLVLDDWFSLAGAMGRMTWNLVFPVHPAVYYSESSPLNNWGLVLIFVLALCALVLWVTSVPKTRKLALALGLAVGVFVAPQAAFILGMREYLATDRYFFLALPYMVLLFALLLQPKIVSARAQKWTAAAVSLACAWFAFVSWRAVPTWRSEKQLFKDCVAAEDSGKCWAMLMESEYNEGGCLAIHTLFDAAHKIVQKLPNNKPAGVAIRAELPLYEGICMATISNMSVNQRMQLFTNLKQQHGNSPGYAFGEILLLLEQGKQQDAALLFANATVGSIGSGFGVGHDIKTMQVFYGMGLEMCKSITIMSNFCETNFWPLITKTIQPHQAQESAINTAVNLTRQALAMGTAR
jgi:hypothetical protein